MSSDPYSFLDLKLPVNGQPTEALAFRFASWRKIIRALNIYFKEFASVQDEIYRQNIRLSHSINFPFFQYGTAAEASAAATAAEVAATLDHKAPISYHTSGMHPEDEQTCRNFLPYGSQSISDIPASLLVFHTTQAEAAHRASKELVYNIIPRLEDLRRDLLVKIKEIKNLSSDFKNAVSKEQMQTHRELAAFNASIEMLVNNPIPVNAKNDPYLLKQSVGKQLARQVNEENYLLEAYLNIQSSGKELERVVAQEIQSALNVFGKLVGSEAVNLQTLLSTKILKEYVDSDPIKEWDAFIERDPNFVDPTLKLRNIQDLSYPNMNSSLNYEIRSGYLERRSKYLKSYSRAWYVLTPTFLHEFKSSDRRKDPYPVMSLPLSDCSLELDKKTSGSHKFILNTKQSRGHKWVFRAESQDKLREWYQDLATLSNIDTPVARALKYFPSQDPVETFNPPPQPQQQEFGQKSPYLNVSSPTRPLSRNSALSHDDNIDPLDRSTPSSTVIPVAGAATVAAAAATLSPTLSVSRASSPSARSRHKHTSSRVGSPNNGDLTPASPRLADLTPVRSDTSEVTSTGEPYGAGIEEHIYSHEPSVKDEEIAVNRSANRGRFPSEVLTNGDGAGAGAAAATAAGGVVISKTYGSAIDDDSSVFSYDLKKGTHSTLPYDQDFEPVQSGIPVSVERRLTQTNHKDEALAALTSGIGVARGVNDGTGSEAVPQTPSDPHEAIAQRRNSVLSSTGGLQRRPSRRPTGSFGVEDGLAPLTPADDPTSKSGAAPLFFSGGLPQTTSSGTHHA